MRQHPHPGERSNVRFVSEFQPSGISASSAALHKRHVNELIQESSETPPAEPTGFMCECSSADCMQVVWLASDDYTAHRVDPGWALRAPGHERVAEPAQMSVG
jgi:hypothetical protein